MKRWLLVMPLLFGPVASAAKADSIWDRRDPRYAELFKDNRARSVGDIVTIVLNETTTTNDREQRANDKRNQTGLTITGSNGLNTAGALDSRKQFNGGAQLTSGRTFTDRMAGTVVDVMPNGNLVIEGFRSRVVAGEERVLRITGVVRPADIGAGNAIQSTSIANARLNYTGRGPQSSSVNQNWLGRVVNRAWPW